MPARTVVFDSTRKHDGVRTRDLFPGRHGLRTLSSNIVYLPSGIDNISRKVPMLLASQCCGMTGNSDCFLNWLNQVNM